MLNLHDMKEQPGQSILNLYSLLSYVCFLEIIPLMLRSFLTLALTDDFEPVLEPIYSIAAPCLHCIVLLQN